MECLHIGTRPPNFDNWESKTLYIHNFLDLSDVRSNDNVVSSPTFHCFGHEWRLDIYPAGDNNARAGRMSVYLCHCSSAEITLDWNIVLIMMGRREIDVDLDYGHTFDAFNSRVGRDVISRSNLLRYPADYLRNGSLVFKVQMKLSEDSDGNDRIADNDSSRYDNTEIFLDDENFDIAFDVKGTLVVAHKCILKAHAKDFYVMCEAFDKTTPMLINDVDPTVFKLILRSSYGGSISTKDWDNHSQSILKAAGKYGFGRLKSEAELWYTKSLKFTVDNVINEFLKADGNDWGVVRKAALGFMAKHGEEVVASESFSRLHESLPLMREVMTAALQNSRKRRRSDSE